MAKKDPGEFIKTEIPKGLLSRTGDKKNIIAASLIQGQAEDQESGIREGNGTGSLLLPPSKGTTGEGSLFGSEEREPFQGQGFRLGLPRPPIPARSDILKPLSPEELEQKARTFVRDIVREEQVASEESEEFDFSNIDVDQEAAEGAAFIAGNTPLPSDIFDLGDPDVIAQNMARNLALMERESKSQNSPDVQTSLALLPSDPGMQRTTEVQGEFKRIDFGPGQGEITTRETPGPAVQPSPILRPSMFAGGHTLTTPILGLPVSQPLSLFQHARITSERSAAAFQQSRAAFGRESSANLVRGIVSRANSARPSVSASDASTIPNMRAASREFGRPLRNDEEESRHAHENTALGGGGHEEKHADESLIGSAISSAHADIVGDLSGGVLPGEEESKRRVVSSDAAGVLPTLVAASQAAASGRSGETPNISAALREALVGGGIDLDGDGDFSPAELAAAQNGEVTLARVAKVSALLHRLENEPALAESLGLVGGDFQRLQISRKSVDIRDPGDTAGNQVNLIQQANAQFLSDLNIWNTSFSQA